MDLEGKIKKSAKLDRLDFSVKVKAAIINNVTLNGKKVASVNEGNKYAFFYRPYNEHAHVISQLKPLLAYLRKNHYQTNIDGHIKSRE